MPRSNLGSCALGLALLAGCLAPTDESSPAAPPAHPPAQPPAQDPIPPPDVKPPDTTPPVVNVPGDEYDAAHHRVLYADCAAGTLMGMDLATGERRVMVDAWPWTQSGGNVCVDSFVVDPSGEHVYAVVDRIYPQPDSAGAVTCIATELVAIETASGKTSSLSSNACCGDCSSSLDTHALQFDAASGRLIHLDEACEGSACERYLTSTALSESAQPLMRPVSSDQAGGARAESFTFDPADPQNVLVLLDDRTVDRLHLDTGARSKAAAIPAAWDDEIEIQYPTGITVDPTTGREYVAAVALWPGPDALFVVVEVDPDSGEQSLLYDGSPTADGTTIACHPEPSFDTRDQRILMVEPVDASGCAGRVFAVDAATGELSLVADAGL